ncbi:unnamed protein product [Arctogadus glacialis]
MQNQLQNSQEELVSTNRSSVFSGHQGDLALTAVFLDEYHDRLFLGGKDVLYSLTLGPAATESKEIHWPPLPGNRDDCIQRGKEPQQTGDNVRTPASSDHSHAFKHETEVSCPAVLSPLISFLCILSPAPVYRKTNSGEEHTLTQGNQM